MTGAKLIPSYSYMTWPGPLVRGGAFVQLVYGDIEAAKEALAQERSGQLRVLDARSESYLQKQAP